MALAPTLTYAAGPPPRRVDLYGDPLRSGAVARMGTVRFCGVSAWHMTYTPDGTALVVGGSDRLVHVMSPKTGRILRSFGPPAASLTGMAIDRKGRMLATAAYIGPYTENNELCLWDFATARLLHRLKGITSQVYGLAFSPDGQRLVSGCFDGSVRVWDTATGKQLRALRESGRSSLTITWAGFSPDGNWLAVASRSRRVYLYDTATWKLSRELPGPVDSFTGAAFTPDSKKLFTAAYDKTIRLWDVAQGKELRQFNMPASHPRPILSPDGKVLVVGGPRLRAHDAASGKELWSARPEGGLPSFHALAFAPDGETIAACNEHMVTLWDASTGKHLNPDKAPPRWVSRVALAPDGKELASAYDDASVRTWSASGEEKTRSNRMSPNLLCSLGYAKSGRLLAGAIAIDKGSSPSLELRDLQLLDVRAGKAVARLDKGGYGHLFATDSTGNHVVTATQKEGLVRWDTATGKTCELTGPRDVPRAAAISPDGSMVAWTRRGLWLWDEVTGTKRGPFGKALANGDFIDFSPDGRTVVTCHQGRAPDGDGGSFILWDAMTGEQRLSIGVANNGRAEGAISPDGRTLAVSLQGRAWLFDLASGARLARLAGHRGHVSALTFSADGTRLASGSADTTVLVWDMSALMPPRRPENPLAARQLEELWGELASDAEKAHKAIWALADAPASSVPFLKERLVKGLAASLANVKQLIAELGADKFATRDKAAKALERLGHLSEPRSARR